MMVRGQVTNEGYIGDVGLRGGYDVGGWGRDERARSLAVDVEALDTIGKILKTIVSIKTYLVTNKHWRAVDSI